MLLLPGEQYDTKLYWYYLVGREFYLYYVDDGRKN